MPLQFCLSASHFVFAVLTCDIFCSFHERCVKDDSECNDALLENMVPIVNGLDTESDPSLVKQEKKVKRKRRQRRLYSETEGLSLYYWQASISHMQSVAISWHI